MFQDLKPWDTTIRESQIALDRLPDLLGEALMQPPAASNVTVNLANVVDEDTTPLLNAFVTEDVMPAVLKYIDDIYGMVPVRLDHKSWIRVSADGSGLVIHEHSGAHLTCIVTLEGNDGDLVFQDPRGNAGRAYPMSIRDTHFQPQIFDVKVGRCLIFPSYLFHYVDRHTPSLRAVLTTDFFLKDK